MPADFRAGPRTAHAPESRAGLARGQYVPKVKEFAEIVLRDGTTLKGHVFIDVTSRMQDMLNAAPAFFPMVDVHDEVHLINKAAVIRMRPYDG
ncbi:MAG: hypothetical protein ACKVSF_14150 [Alphaproteobacteria bacterium]